MSWPELLDAARTALATIMVALVWTAVAYLRSVRFKFEESKDREALHSAVRTGIRDELELDPLASDKQVAVAAARHVLDKGAPDAVKAFDLSGGDLNRIIISKVGEERAQMAEKRPC
jgi:hypothetical protein